MHIGKGFSRLIANPYGHISKMYVVEFSYITKQERKPHSLAKIESEPGC